jgi:hypothetical protein
LSRRINSQLDFQELALFPAEFDGFDMIGQSLVVQIAVGRSGTAEHSTIPTA